MACIDPHRRFQDRDNYVWIQNADRNKLVVGTQAQTNTEGDHITLPFVPDEGLVDDVEIAQSIAKKARHSSGVGES